MLLDRLYRANKRKAWGDYKVFIKCENIKQNSSTKQINHNSNEPKMRRVINFWAFTPGIAMEELKALGARSLILTSGTLSPMDALKQDMKLPFQICLANPHGIHMKYDIYYYPVNRINMHKHIYSQ